MPATRACMLGFGLLLLAGPLPAADEAPNRIETALTLSATTGAPILAVAGSNS